MRIGHGYDVHRLTEGRKLILGGVDIPYEKGLLGHSDADVLAHAIMDSILGALALGDIGKLFPDNDPDYEGADSMKLMEKVISVMTEKGWKLTTEKEESREKIRKELEEKLHEEFKTARIMITIELDVTVF